MTTALDIPVFILSLALTLAAAAWFARMLDRVGVALGLPEALVGLLTAVAADAPEVTSALVAVAKDAPAAGLGVVLGSNVFNLAAMIGAGAVVAGGIRVRRPTVLLEGSVGLVIFGVAVLLLTRVVPAFVAVIAIVAVTVPYVALLVSGRRALHGLHAESHATEELADALAERERHVTVSVPDDFAVWRTAALLVPAGAAIVGGSVGMVNAALDLADRWSVPTTLVGTLILATMTSFPNAATAIRLARMRRGAAVVSETMNSNTINLMFGIAVPALFIAAARVDGGTAFDLAALAVMTLVTLALLTRRAGVGRATGGLLVLLYIAFVLVHAVGNF